MPDGKWVALDGNTVRNTGAKFMAQNAFHLVSPWAPDDGRVLGHVAVGEKSTGISAIPEIRKAIATPCATVKND